MNGFYQDRTKQCSTFFRNNVGLLQSHTWTNKKTAKMSVYVHRFSPFLLSNACNYLYVHLSLIFVKVIRLYAEKPHILLSFSNKKRQYFNLL